jgi:putative YphP/YqiW family bacilliredoxin
MTYPEFFVAPMRQELTSLGVRELRTAAEVDAVLGRQLGQPGDQQGPTVMVIVNSVCGCAAGKARPGVAIALKNKTLPDRVVTVFAGADIEATDHARSYFKGYPPSSPSVGLLRDGELVYMLQRHQIEGREAPQIASELTAAFDRHCAKAKVSQ